VETTSAKRARKAILESCGATLPRRDAVDSRVVSWVKQGKTGLINSPQEVGGWPNLKSSRPPQDEDEDGMPDTWETENDLDPGRPDHALDPDGDGYTNIEEYLNGTDPMTGEPPASGR
jgi:hypothetical protein